MGGVRRTVPGTPYPDLIWELEGIREAIESLERTRMVNTGRIVDSAITTNKLSANSVTAAKIQTITLSAGNVLVGGAVVGTIAAGAILTGQLSATAIDGMVITGATVRTSAANPRVQMTSGELVGTDSTGAITFKINALTGDVELKGTIKPGSSGLGNISGQIDGTANVVPATIQGDRLVADTIGAREIAVASLAAITATLGEVNAGTITGSTFRTISGGQVETSAVNPRIVLSAAGLQGYDSAGTVTLSVSETAVAGRTLQVRNSAGALVGGTEYVSDRVTVYAQPPAGGTNVSQIQVSARGSGAHVERKLLAYDATSDFLGAGLTVPNEARFAAKTTAGSGQEFLVGRANNDWCYLIGNKATALFIAGDGDRLVIRGSDGSSDALRNVHLADAHQFGNRGFSAWGTLNAGSYVTQSDERLKDKIEPLTDAAERVRQLRPVSFERRADGPRRVLGLVAQEVERCVPEVVEHASDSTSGEGTSVGIDYAQVTALLARHNQEQQDELDGLAERTAELERRAVLRPA